MQVPKDVVQRAVGTLLAAQMSLLPLAGVSYAALDTETTKKGLGATIEYSDITKEDQQSVGRPLAQKASSAYILRASSTLKSMLVR